MKTNVMILMLLALIPAVHAQQEPFSAQARSQVRQTLFAERAANVEREFDELLRIAPDSVVEATVTFSESVSIDSAVEAFLKSGFVISGFRHSHGSIAGGYTMREGESLEEAIASYKRDVEFFSRRALARVNALLSDPAHIARRAEIEVLRKKLMDRQREVELHDLRVTAIDVDGTPRQLANLRVVHPFIDLIEQRSGSRRNASVPRRK